MPGSGSGPLRGGLSLPAGRLALQDDGAVDAGGVGGAGGAGGDDPGVALMAPSGDPKGMMDHQVVRTDGSLREGGTWRSWTRDLDLLACATVVGLACLAAMTLPEGSIVRLAVAIAGLFVAPGYLLVEAAAGPARSVAARVRRAALSVGVSPAIVGLLALATAGLPGGFRPASIILLLGVTCLALAAAALWRRRAHGRQSIARPTLA